ncbi:MAG: PAS domain S-box protein [Planctomycetaceae bacterium]|nr:PAS domain S-box protein [Planctomycetaceae bacterium]
MAAEESNPNFTVQNSTVLICSSTGIVQRVIAICPVLQQQISAGMNLNQVLAVSGPETFEHIWEQIRTTQQTAELVCGLRNSGVHAPAGLLLRVLVSPLYSQQANSDVIVVFCRSERSTDEGATFRAVLQTAVDVIITIDAEGIINSVNPAVEGMFGYAPQELVGRNVSMMMPEPHAGEHNRYLETYLQTGVASIMGVGRRVMGLHRDGHQFPVHLSVSEFRLGEKRLFTGIIHNLSQLERMQQQLLQSERLAAIGQMVTGLAHESRNALQRAQACLDMLALDLEGQPDQLDLARRTTTALQDLHRLYEEVRGYAAPIHLEYRPVELPTIWRKEWEHLAAVRAERHVTLQDVAVDESIRCEVDVHRIEQVFRNILENAIHACGDEGTVAVSLKREERAGIPFVRLEFADDGCGLSLTVKERLFEPFFTTKQKGTGLGMAIVERIIDAHHGMISAQTNASGGTTIRIDLPQHPAARRGQRLPSGG